MPKWPGLTRRVRKRTDALDSLGNTTAATGKGFAIGSAALTALALISAYKEKIILEGGDMFLNLMDPLVLVGLFIGTMMPYLFSSLTMSAVGRAAGKVVVEVRRQFKEIPGIMEGNGQAGICQMCRYCDHGGPCGNALTGDYCDADSDCDWSFIRD